MSLARRLACAIAVFGLVTVACTGGSDDDSTGGATTEVDDGAEPGDDAPGTPIPSDDDVAVGQLDNGLTYYVRENDNPGGRAELRLAIDAGSVLEDDDQSGVAHFLEHMMFNGTEQYPENELIRVLESFGTEFGADINAYTSYDETVYSLSIPTADPELFATALGILGEWLSAATLREADVVAERGVVLDEWRQSEESSSGRIFDAIEDLFFAGTAYDGRDPIGTDTAIEAMAPDGLRRFYDEWYRPDNAAVVVVGDVDAEEVVAAIAAEFGPLAARGDGRERPEITWDPTPEPEAAVHLDPDEATGFVELTLPMPVEEQTTTADLAAAVRLQLAFDMIATRLSDDATRGGVPFTAASVDSNDHVRAIDAPSVLVEAGGDDLGAALEALVTEFVRVDQHGFTPSELDRAVRSFRASVDAALDGADSTQDTDFAALYVGSFLEGYPTPDAETEHELWVDALDAVDVDAVDAAFRARWETAGAHLLAIGPDDADAPTEDEMLAVLADVSSRELDEREFDDVAIDRLMDAPEPVEESERVELTAVPQNFLEPTMLTFPNGLRVILNETSISEGTVAFGGSSAGGLSVVPDGDVADALAAPTVVTSSGVGEFDQVTLEQVLADATLELAPYLDLTSENLFGSTATSDLETFLQVLHLYVTAPHVTETALATYVDQVRPYAEDPLSDPDLAGTVTLLEARYGDALPRFRVLPTVEDVDAYDASVMERIWRERFGDVSDWVFVFSGDFDTDELVDLARVYLGTLPGAGRQEDWVDLQPDPPAGVVSRDVAAGTGDRATLTLLYTAPIVEDPRNAVAAEVLSSVLNMRLTEHIREALGASYSPFAYATVATEPDSVVETYVQVTGSPDGIEELRSVVQEDLAALRTAGPTEDELAAAVEELRNNLELFSNEGLIDVLIDEGLHGDAIEPFRRLPEYLGTIDAAAVTTLANQVLPADTYIEVVVRPA